MTLDSIVINIEENIKNANQVKELVLYRLVRDGIITEELYEKYTTSWNIIIVKKSWFAKWWDKVISGNDGYVYKFVQF